MLCFLLLGMVTNYAQTLKNNVLLILLSSLVWGQFENVQYKVNVWSEEKNYPVSTVSIICDTILIDSMIYIDDFIFESKFLDSIAQFNELEKDYRVGNNIITMLSSFKNLDRGEEFCLAKFFIRKDQSSNALSFIYSKKYGVIIKEYSHKKSKLKFIINGIDTSFTQKIVEFALTDSSLFPTMPSIPNLPKKSPHY